MLGHVAEKIVAWQISKGTLVQEQEAVYQYAYELLLNQMINLMLAGILAALFQMPAEVALFLLCCIPLRTYSGGYHADTNLGCTIVSVLIISVACYIYQVASFDILRWYPSLYIVSGIIIYSCIPVQDHNKPLDNKETVRYKRRGRMILQIEIILGLILYLFKIRLGFIIALSHMILAVLLIVGILKNKVISLKASP